MRLVWKSIRESLTRRHPDEGILLLVVFFCIYLSSTYLVPFLLSAQNAPAAPGIAFPPGLAMLMLGFVLDLYLRVTVYATLKDMVMLGTWSRRSFLRNGLPYIGRVLAYELLVGTIAVILVSVVLAVAEATATPAVFPGTAFFFLAVAWAAVPFYFLAASFLAPLIILVENRELFPAVAGSIAFFRGHLKELVVLALVFGLAWAVVLFGNRVYNLPESFLRVEILARSAALSLLEVYTFKTFMLYYRTATRELP